MIMILSEKSPLLTKPAKYVAPPTSHQLLIRPRSTEDYDHKKANGRWINTYMDWVANMVGRSTGTRFNFGRGGVIDQNCFDQIAKRHPAMATIMVDFTNQYFDQWERDHTSVLEWEAVRVAQRPSCSMCEKKDAWVPQRCEDSLGRFVKDRQFTCKKDCDDFINRCASYVEQTVSMDTHQLSYWWSEFIAINQIPSVDHFIYSDFIVNTANDYRWRTIPYPQPQPLPLKGINTLMRKARGWTS